MSTMGIRVRRAGERFLTRTDWLESRHSFSYGPHYDPVNAHFGLLLAANEDRLAPGAGFDEHPHRDVEVVTWVLSGALAHADSAGHRGVARPGVVQRMSAGGGIRHAEHAVGPEPAHYVQMWVRPESPGGRPAYDTVDLTADLAAGRLVRIPPLRQRVAVLHAGRLAAGAPIVLPAAPYVHLFVARGAVDLHGAGTLGTGDAARLTDAVSTSLTARTSAEVLAWEMHATIGG